MLPTVDSRTTSTTTSSKIRREVGEETIAGVVAPMADNNRIGGVVQKRTMVFSSSEINIHRRRNITITGALAACLHVAAATTATATRDEGVPGRNR